MDEPTPHILSLELPAAIESLPRCIDFLFKAAQESGFGVSELNKIELAAEEAIVNIIHYAYGGKSGNIKVTCKSENNNKFLIEITDSGSPFNPLNAKKPDLDADINDRLIGGLGIYLTEKLVDIIEYKREEDKNILTLTILKSA